MKFYLTFGCCTIFRNNWVEVMAPDYAEARRLVFSQFGKEWSMLYHEEDFQKKFFPEGKIGETLEG